MLGVIIYNNYRSHANKLEAEEKSNTSSLTYRRTSSQLQQRDRSCVTSARTLTPHVSSLALRSLLVRFSSLIITCFSPAQRYFYHTTMIILSSGPSRRTCKLYIVGLTMPARQFFPRSRPFSAAVPPRIRADRAF